ncbi:hypothetical protein AB0C59_18535 [Streptomyces sp. NPDC048664]|uniref:hypothetical protein n=1 Tax=Streptomyces sp. NPDC048664 TaxID=3154505 RepID=UPI0034284BDF
MTLLTSPRVAEQSSSTTIEVLAEGAGLFSAKPKTLTARAPPVTQTLESGLPRLKQFRSPTPIAASIFHAYPSYPVPRSTADSAPHPRKPMLWLPAPVTSYPMPQWSAAQPVKEQLAPAAPPATPWMSQPWLPLPAEVTPMNVDTMGLDRSMPESRKYFTLTRENSRDTVAGLATRVSAMPLPVPPPGPWKVRSCRVSRVMSEPVSPPAEALD